MPEINPMRTMLSVVWGAIKSNDIITETPSHINDRTDNAITFIEGMAERAGKEFRYGY